MPVQKSELSRTALTKYFISNLLILGFLKLILLVPYNKRVPMMGWLVSRVLAPLAGFHKRIRNNLKLTHPDMDEAEIQQICLDVPNNAGRVLIEYYSGKDFIAHAQAATASGSGIAALDQARSQGRGIIFVSAHFGNYEAARAYVTSKGYGMGALYRRMANPYFNDHYLRTLAAISEPIFEQGRRGMMQLVKHLRAGGNLCILTDLHVIDGKKLQYFGKTAVTSIVPAQLALKYDCLLVPVYAIRQPNGLDFHIEIHEPIAHSDAETMTQLINDDLETIVRKNITQWFWIHRRWKP